MVKCHPWCGLGVRHLQYLLLAVMNMLDFWIQTLNYTIYEEINVLNMTKKQKMNLALYGFLLYTIGRFTSVFAVLRVPNKYGLLFLISLELTMGGIMVWFTDNLGVTYTSMLIILMAFCRSFHSTFMYNILSKWMPPSDYTTAFCIVTMTKDMFTFLLSSKIHGRSFVQTAIVLQIFTFIYFGWCALYLVFGAESPQTCFLISKEEWNYLAKNVGPRKKINCKAKIPWRAILKTLMLYLYTLFDFGKEANASVISNAVTTIVIHNTVGGTGLFAMQVVLTAYSFGLLVSCYYYDYYVANEKIENGPARKVVTTVGCCGVATTMILTAYVDKHSIKIAYLFVAHCCFMIVHTVGPAILFDLSPNYAALLYATSSTMRNWMNLARQFVDNNSNVKAFDMNLKGKSVMTHIGNSVPDGLIYRYGFLIFFTNLFLIIGGNIELRDFDSYDTHDWRRESIISYP